MMIYVLYHGNCYDGFGAAFSAWKKFGDNAKYIPVSYGYPLPELEKPDLVYILDFSYSKQELEALAARAFVVVLDHHKTAEETLRTASSPSLSINFDMEKSGALLAWENFHPHTPVPEQIQHISDRDLWKFEIPFSREVHRALVSFPFDFKVWDAFDINSLRSQGAALELMHGQLVSNICDKAYVTILNGEQVPTVNTSIAWSEVGEELLKRNPNAKFVASFTVFSEQVMWSLRSDKNGLNTDVSEVAKKFGGGGQRNAAGFKTAKV